MSELVIENVSYRYKNADRLALNGVSCAFKPGQVTAVVGPSGSGKTTLLSIMAGLDRPGEGQVLLNGADWTPTGGRMCRSSSRRSSSFHF